jgi:hypothetical protein
MACVHDLPTIEANPLTEDTMNAKQVFAVAALIIAPFAAQAEGPIVIDFKETASVRTRAEVRADVLALTSAGALQYGEFGGPNFMTPDSMLSREAVRAEVLAVDASKRRYGEVQSL